jgi:glycosyltransferase involved in cell wall biosynthesis
MAVAPKSLVVETVNKAPAVARRALVIAPSRDLTFVEDDIQLLSGIYDVEVLTRRDYPSRRRLLPEVLRRFWRRRYDLLYVWFAEPHDAPFVLGAARVAGVPCAVVVGGYEVASLPQFNYGGLTARRDRWKVRAALWAADLVLPTSQLLTDEVRRLGRRHGVCVIYPGVDIDVFTPPDSAKERLVVSVATLGTATWRLKGLDVLAQCSRLLPDVEFIILGPVSDPEVVDKLKEMGGANLTIVGRRLSRAELAGYFQRAAVYAQLSARESFGLALAEAMACGCVPVASAVGAISEVVGDTGFLVAYGDAKAAAGAILQGVAIGGGRGASQRVRRLFPAERRAAALRGALDRLRRREAI